MISILVSLILRKDFSLNRFVFEKILYNWENLCYTVFGYRIDGFADLAPTGKTPTLNDLAGK